jgi:hypothetical protein
VQPVHLILTLGVGFEEVAKGSESGIIHQQTEVRRVADAGGYCGQRSVLSQIRRQGLGVYVILFAELASQGLQAILPARDEQ